MLIHILTQTFYNRKSVKSLEIHLKKNVIVDFCKRIFMQLLGMKDFRKQNLSYVTVGIWETTRKGQSSHGVKVRDDCSFVALLDWNVESPRKYELSELTRANSQF